MRFFVAAVVAFGIMTIDFRANNNSQGSILAEAAAQAERKANLRNIQLAKSGVYQSLDGLG